MIQKFLLSAKYVLTDFTVEIQPVGGPRAGRVQISNKGRQGLICSTGWDSRDAAVVCQEKNLGTNGTATQLAYNETEAVWLNGVSCIGNESRLTVCPNDGIGIVDDCALVAGVECFGKTDTATVHVAT